MTRISVQTPRRLWRLAAAATCLAAICLAAISVPLAAQTLPLNKWTRHVVDHDKPWRSVFVASDDLDQDGFGDIVTGGWWYRNPGSSGGKWQRISLGEPLNNMAALYDFDADGDMDVLGTAGKASEPNATFVWAENKSRGKFTIRRNIAQGEGDFLQGVAVGSLTENSLSVVLSWHRGNDGIQTLQVPAKPADDPWTWRRISPVSQDEQISIGRIDDNASLDILLGTKWLSNRNGHWEVHTLHQPPGTPDRNRLVDMNQDGRLDAVVGYQAVNRLGNLVWYARPEDPRQLWQEHLIAEVIGPMSVDVADVDRDGDPDVVVGEHNYDHPETARLLLFENDNGLATSWTPHVIHTGDEHHDGAVFVDIDRDGDLDVISIGWKEPEVWLYENRAIE